MMIRIAFVTLVAAALIGCDNSGSAGDVKSAEAAAKAAPRSVEQLPQDMPPEARRAAEAAMGQSQAAQAQMNAQAEAMKNARAKMGQR